MEFGWKISFSAVKFDASKSWSFFLAYLSLNSGSILIFVYFSSLKKNVESKKNHGPDRTLISIFWTRHNKLFLWRLPVLHNFVSFSLLPLKFVIYRLSTAYKEQRTTNTEVEIDWWNLHSLLHTYNQLIRNIPPSNKKPINIRLILLPRMTTFITSLMTTHKYNFFGRKNRL